ncbi:alanine--tRNA ligase-related protein [Streptosporangium canum]
MLPELLPVARDRMAPSSPEVAADFDRIASYAYGEEESFDATLNQGNAVLQRELGKATTRLLGSTAFQLHDTYGFPIDLTVEIAGAPSSASPPAPAESATSSKPHSLSPISDTATQRESH